jgi:LuxR family transcriptional regulator, quorum-sensing system regulator CviR
MMARIIRDPAQINTIRPVRSHHVIESCNMHGRGGDIILSSSDPSEFSTCLSRNDALKLLEFIHRSISCNDEEAFRALFPRLQELIPFDFATVVLGHLDDCKGIVTSLLVNISFSEEWFREYNSKEYIQKSAVIRENFTTYKLQYWTNVWKKLRQPEEIISLCMDFDMRQGFTCGSRSLAPSKNGSMFCFSSSSMKHDKRSAAILEFITPHLHLALSNIFNQKRLHTNSFELSSREKEVLDWLKQGKSSWDISVILGISERTVNFHVYKIMQKLGATNRPQAVAVAAHYGLIDFN